jgi:hypothetical protein
LKSPVQLPLPHPLLFFHLHRQLEDIFGHPADVIGSLENRLAALAIAELEVEETTSFTGFKDAFLLGGVFGQEFLEGDGLEIDCFELRRSREWWVCLRSEFGGVRHCCNMLVREDDVGVEVDP